MALAAPLFTSALLSPRSPSVAVTSTTRGGWGHGGYTSAEAGMQQGHKELYASTQQLHDELYMQARNNNTRNFQLCSIFLIVRHIFA